MALSDHSSSLQINGSRQVALFVVSMHTCIYMALFHWVCSGNASPTRLGPLPDQKAQLSLGGPKVGSRQLETPSIALWCAVPLRLRKAEAPEAALSILTLKLAQVSKHQLRFPTVSLAGCC